MEIPSNSFEVTTTNSVELLKAQAQTQLDEVFRENNYEQLTTTERVSLLRTLIGEYAATIEGTNIPVDNNNRFIVEALAGYLKTEEDREQLDFSVVSSTLA